MEVNRITIDGTQSGKAQLPAALFSAKVAVALLWEAVKAQQARWRQGTHSTKTRANVSGGGAKPFKQKGTGQARQGSNRAPNHVGGGTVFGPHPRDYGYEIPKSARKAALKSALSACIRAGSLCSGLHSFECPKHQSYGRAAQDPTLCFGVGCGP